jgi:hypothetical protein
MLQCQQAILMEWRINIYVYENNSEVNEGACDASKLKLPVCDELISEQSTLVSVQLNSGPSPNIRSWVTFVVQVKPIVLQTLC